MKKLSAFILFVSLAIVYVWVAEMMVPSVEGTVISDVHTEVNEPDCRNFNNDFYHFSDIEIGTWAETYSHQRVNTLRLAHAWGNDISSLLKTLFRNLSYRDKLLAQRYSHIYCTSVILPAGEPSCQYFIYRFRHIII